jgi:GT2 family glycosyltransferase
VTGADWPTVTVVFLVYNRREELRTSLRRMLVESDYERGRVDVIVVDNASSDGSADMVRDEFPHVELIRRSENVGVSGWNDGFARARGDYVLALDDDCYLPPDGLRRAVAEARAHEADLVSFGVTSSFDTSHRFDLVYRTGLLSFWGCAVLIRRAALQELRGYDPGIFVWANEVEFMLRFFDRGYRHLYLPEVVAVHMKPAHSEHWTDYVRSAPYKRNTRHWAYIAARHLRARDALETLVALLAVNLRDAVSVDRRALAVMPGGIAGFASGLRRRRPVRREISRAYRQNFESFASPWWFSRPPRELLRALPRELARAATGAPSGPEPSLDKAGYYDARPRYYPRSAQTLRF